MSPSAILDPSVDFPESGSEIEPAEPKLLLLLMLCRRGVGPTLSLLDMFALGLRLELELLVLVCVKFRETR